MKVQIIIVNWNTKDLLDQCLQSLFSQDKNNIDLQISVVDNNSDDHSVFMVREKYPQVNLLANPENIGLSRASNLFWKKTSADYVLFLNPDTTFSQKNAIEKLVYFAEKDPDIGIVGPKIIYPDGKTQNSISYFPSLIPSIMWLFKLHKFSFFLKIPPLKEYLQLDLDLEKTHSAEHLLGACLLIRKKVWERIGFLDENFWLWFEETDYCLRAQQAGFKIIYYPQVTLIHHESQSIKQHSSPKKQRIWNKSLLYYYQKNKPYWQYIILKPFTQISLGLVILTNLIRNKFKKG